MKRAKQLLRWCLKMCNSFITGFYPALIWACSQGPLGSEIVAWKDARAEIREDGVHLPFKYPLWTMTSVWSKRNGTQDFGLLFMALPLTVIQTNPPHFSVCSSPCLWCDAKFSRGAVKMTWLVLWLTGITLCPHKGTRSSTRLHLSKPRAFPFHLELPQFCAE